MRSTMSFPSVFGISVMTLPHKSGTTMPTKNKHRLRNVNTLLRRPGSTASPKNVCHCALYSAMPPTVMPRNTKNAVMRCSPNSGTEP